jgi:hypothetical protein
MTDDVPRPRRNVSRASGVARPRSVDRGGLG